MRGVGLDFAVGIVVARISGPAGLGAFAFAYTVWILLTTLHRSMITDPMAIMGDIRGDEKDKYVRRGFAADVTLGLMAACVIAAVGSALLVVGQHTFGIGMLSVAPWIIFLDLQDYWRWIGFMQGTPRKALVNDILFTAVQAVAFGVVFVAGIHSVFAVVSAWGLGRRRLPPSTVSGNSWCARPYGEEEPSCGPVGPSASGWPASGRPAGGDPAVPHHCRRSAGPDGTRRFESFRVSDRGLGIVADVALLADLRSRPSATSDSTASAAVTTCSGRALRSAAE